MAKTEKPRRDWHQEVADEIIRQIEAGTAPWQRAWAPGEGMDMPTNAATGKPYRGMNAVWLSMQGRTDPRWMTYNQAQAIGAQVKKGAKSSMVTYWKTHDERVERNPATGEKITVRTELERPRPFSALVFNGEQIDGLPPLEPRKIEAWEAHRRAEAVLTGSGADIHHAPQDRAAYIPSRDMIVLPERGQFPTPDGYYSVAFHELAHWTGHESRMNRPIENPFGSPEYAREELRAEIASMLLGRELGIGYTPQNTAAYAASWIKALEGDKMEIHRATRDAGKMSEYMLDFEQQNQQQQEAPAMENTPKIEIVNMTVQGIPYTHIVADLNVNGTPIEGLRIAEYSGGTASTSLDIDIADMQDDRLDEIVAAAGLSGQYDASTSHVAWFLRDSGILADVLAEAETVYIQHMDREQVAEAAEPMYMNRETGSVGTRDDWDYETEDGKTVNAVDLGEVDEAARDERGNWIEAPLNTPEPQPQTPAQIWDTAMAAVMEVKSSSTGYYEIDPGNDALSAAMRLPDDARTPEMYRWIAENVALPEQVDIRPALKSADLDPSTRALFELAAGEKQYAVSLDGLALQHIPWTERTPGLSLAAVMQNGAALEFVPKDQRDMDVCREAMRTNPDGAIPHLTMEAVEFYGPLDTAPFIAAARESGDILTPQLAGQIIGAAVQRTAAQCDMSVQDTLAQIAEGSAANQFRFLVRSADADLAEAGIAGTVTAHLTAFEAAHDRIREAPAIEPTTPTPAPRAKQAEMEIDD